MGQERRHLNWLGAIGLFILGILVWATMATAEDILPMSEEVLAPVSDTAIEKKSGTPETLGPVHGLPPVDAHTYQALKARAQTTAASQAEALLESRSGPEPLVPAVTTSFVGLDQANAGNVSHSDATVGKSTFRVLEAVNASLRLFTAVGGGTRDEDPQHLLRCCCRSGTLPRPQGLLRPECRKPPFLRRCSPA